MEFNHWNIFDLCYDNFIALSKINMNLELKHKFSEKRLAEVFESEPQMCQNAPKVVLETWKKLGPMSIEEIIKNSKEFLDIDPN